MTPLVIRNTWALGDTVCLSALVRDIQLAHPGQYQVFLAGHYKSFWNNNPHAKVLQDGEPPPAGAVQVHAEYRKGIKEANERKSKIHFLAWFHRDFQEKTGISVPVSLPKGDIHLNSKELRPPLTGRYWVVVAGGKLDITAKVWAPSRYQEVVHLLAEQGIACVQVGANHDRHFHPKLQGVVNLVGATDSIRDLFSLIYHCEGVICGVTGAMHIAAAFDKPAVVLAGGREAPWWEAYTNEYQSFGPEAARVQVEHRYLHTLGQLECCLDKGCWRKRTVPITQQDLSDPRRQKELCKLPMQVGKDAVPACLEKISVSQVVQAVQSYYQAGVLLPPVPAPLVLLEPLKPLPAAPPPRQLSPLQGSNEYMLLDDPRIGGRFTVFVLCYGDYPNLARKCIDSILETVPAGRLDLRVLLNEVSPATRQVIQSVPRPPLTVVYDFKTNLKKYPAMRHAFHDPAHPIMTKYLVWFDEDSFAVDRHWAIELGKTILANEASQVGLYGIKWLHDLKGYAKNGHRPDLWFREATWWRNKNFLLRGRNATAPNGSCIEFVSGWFWCLATELVKEADIPDSRLKNNFGDIVVAEQVRQAGKRIKVFNEGKKLVYTPPKEAGGRRGPTDRCLWAEPGK